MATELIEQNLFRPVPRRSVAKADITTQAARAIIDAESEQRFAKTARLRKARLDMERAAQSSAVDTANTVAPRKAKKPKA